MKLPLFPLSLVAFPGEQVNLHIFEPRYRQLISDCEETGMTFGIPPFESGMKLQVGTEIELIEVVNRYPDGKLDISTRAKRRFVIDSFQMKADDKLYPIGSVTHFDDEELEGNETLHTKVQDLVNDLLSIMNLAIGVEALRKFDNVFQIAHKLGLTFEQEVALLKMRSENQRLELVRTHLVDFIPVMRQLNEMKTKIRLNGHFKNPPIPDLDSDL